MSIATFLDDKRIVTGSPDKTIRIWRLENGAEMMKWAVKQCIIALIILENGKQVVSAEGEFPDDLDEDDFDANIVLCWQLWVRDVESGRVVAGPLEAGHLIAVILWDTSTWQKKGHPLLCGSPVGCIRFSPTGQLGVSTDEDIQIWDLDQRKRLARFKSHHDFNDACNYSLTWTRDGAHLLSAGSKEDPVIRSWDTSTWKQAGDPWIGHDEDEPVNHIIFNPAGTILASASDDCTVRLWQFPTGTELAQFKHSDLVFHVAFSADGCSIFSGGYDNKISQLEIPEDVLIAAEIDAPASVKNEAALRKQKAKRLFNSELPGQRRNKPATYQPFDTSQGWDTHSASPFAHGGRPSSSRLPDLKTFFDGIRPSSDKEGKQKERRPKRNALKVVDVPLGTASPGDVVGVDDGIRPYVLFFYLSWFQKKKPDPPRPVYDDELDDDESDHAVLDVPIPTTRTQIDTAKKIKLTPMSFFQSQPEAGPSRLAPPVDIDAVDVPIPITRIVQHKEMELKPIASQSQAEGGPSRLVGLEDHAGERSS
ncbi:WD40-repeat-containing domain protein [Suillus subaureus]|uniref:WD40-repeat-containing domain protein n=1 Tax=Suillus subaureus TaxID=48587 RepID=A0A9P7EEB8_9AGAM|nr:WD40-repeat-containing domain protein [Suillus subaureus]KAG1818751.1 WD40-repeat-containing domain protein [Suillus subaureus]